VERPRLQPYSGPVRTNTQSNAEFPAATDSDIYSHLGAGRYHAAFEVVLPRYRDRVFRLAYSILRDVSAAEDAAQDVFVRLWRALPSYQGDAALSTWIYAITRNTCISLLRKRRLHVSLDEPVFDDGEGLQLAAPEQDDSATSSVRKLLDKLPERYRRAVVLFYMEDKSYEQTAVALQLPLGTVKALLHRARKRLVELTGEQRCIASSSKVRTANAYAALVCTQ
jgi:RNA polymerase sigma-70 factor, ECF subfamily